MPEILSSCGTEASQCYNGQITRSVLDYPKLPQKYQNQSIQCWLKSIAQFSKKKLYFYHR